MNALTEKSTNQRLRFHYLDGLRGIASLYVVFVHIAPSVQEQLPTWLLLFMKTVKYGRFGVVVFIVISGYSLMLPIAHSQSGYVSGGLLGYIKRRSRRILPPYYAALFLCLLLAVARVVLEKFTSFRWDKVAGDEPFSPFFSFNDVLSHLLLIHNLSPDTYHSINGPMWSVATEYQLYFLFPLLLLPIWRRFGLSVVVIAAFLIGIAPLYLLNRLFESASPWFLGLFALGMAAADIGFSPKPKLIAMRNFLPCGVLAIIFTVIAFLTDWKSLGLEIWISETLLGMAAACLFIYSTKCVVQGKSPLIVRLLEHPWAIALGVFSYSLYLIHEPVLTLVHYFLLSLQMSPVMFVVTFYLVGVVMSLVFSYLFYLVFERPFMSGFLKERKVKDAVAEISKKT